MKKWIVILVIVLAGGFWFYQKRGAKPGEPSASESITSRPTTAVVEVRDIDFKVTAAGDIGPSEQVSVRPEVNGKISTLPVDIGDRVKKADILFTLDDSDLQTEHASKLTEIDGAKLQVDRAKRNFERSKELYAAALISKELYEDTKTEYDLAKNSLDRSEKDLRQVEDRLSKTVIKAPFDCTILTRPVSIGQAVSGSGGFNSGTEVLTIADLNKMIVNAHINQADVTRLSSGQEVDIQIESVPGLVLKGTVERIAPQSTIKNSIKGYAARIVLKDVDPRVRPGMTATLSIPVATAGNAVAVPLAAVFTEEGERFCYVKNGEKFEKRVIQVGISDYDFVEVQKGLSPGEVVSLEDRADKTEQSWTGRGGKPIGMAGLPGSTFGRSNLSDRKSSGNTNSAPKTASNGEVGSRRPASGGSSVAR